MPTCHIVKQGEHLSKIAHDYGFRDSNTIWNYPDNAGLKSKRKTPHILLPGDRLYIPDRNEKTETRPTDQLHHFIALGEKLQLNVKVKDVSDKPIANTPCDLQIGFTSYSLVTDSSGIIRHEIPRTTQTGRLVVHAADGEIQIEIRIGSLDPLEEESGQRARLNNLGYNAGEPYSQDSQQFRSAVEEFQCDHQVRPITGVCDARTQARLKEVYGC
jgi:hypothetical protein